MRGESGRKEKGETHGREERPRAASLRKKARSEWVAARRLRRGDFAGEDVIALTTTAGERWAFRAIQFE